MSGIRLLSLAVRNSKLLLLAAAICSAVSPSFGFVLPFERKQAANAAIEKMIASDYGSAIVICDSFIRMDTEDPLGWMLRLSAIGLHDLDLDSMTDSLDFYQAFRKTNAVIFRYETKYGVSSYSLTVKGFSKAVAAAYHLWRKKYITGLDLGFDALAALREAKKRDNANTDVDFFLGLYAYARAELKKTFWWAFFWYSGEKGDGIRTIAACSRTGRFAAPAAALVLSEIYVREKRFGESDSITGGLLRRFPDSRMVLWTKAKEGEAQNMFGPAAAAYGKLADLYDRIPRARKNALLTRSKAAHLLFDGGARAEAKDACVMILARKKGFCDNFCRRMCDDAEKLLARASGGK